MDRMINWKKMCGWELADPVDIESLAALGLDRGPRPGAVVPPHCCRWQIPMHLLLKLDHFDWNDLIRGASGTNDGRDGKGIDIAGEFDAAAYRRWRGHWLSESRHTFAECDSSCGIKSALEKSASAQHFLQPRLMLILCGEVFITSVLCNCRRESFN